MKNTKKLLTLLLSAAMIGAMLTACGPKTPAPDADATPGTEGEAFDLSLCIASEPQSIDPALNSAVDGAIMLQHMFEGLMKWADSGTAVNESAGAAKLVEGQAKSYEITENADGTVTYTFTLRDDIKWSDGKPVTAGDFVYAWQRLATPATAADYNYMIDMVVGADKVMYGTPVLDANGNQVYITKDDKGVEVVVEGLEFDKDGNLTSELPEGATAKNDYADPTTLAVSAPDDKTFVVTIINNCPYFLEICAFPATLPVRQDTIEANGDQWTFKPETFIGNGAYKMTTWEHNAKIVMVPSDTYYDYANLGPDSITFVLMDNNNAMLSGFQSGELQFIEDMPVDEIATLLKDGKLNIVDYIGDYYVCFQNQKAPFDNALVRKAFSLAIDRNYIVEKITQTGQVPATGFVPAGVYDAQGGGFDDFRTVGTDYWDASADAYKANCDEARALLAEAGYPNGEGFPVVEYLYNTSDAHKAVGEALQEMWKQELGVTVTLNNQEWNTFLQTRKDGNYGIARNGWIADYNDPMSFLDMWITGGGNNDAQYNNPAYDELIFAAKKSTDPAERMKLMHQAEDMLIKEDNALAPLYFYTQKYMVADDVKGMFYTPLGYFFFQYCTKA
ncbi:MAG: peptide ABC transporter substrate-binding protein [Oscillospiraceae bacterium]